MAAKKKSDAASRTIDIFTGATPEENAKRMEEEERISTRRTRAKGYDIESDVTWFVLHPLPDNPHTMASLVKHDRGVVLTISTAGVPLSERPEDIVSSRIISLSMPEFLAIKKVIESW